MSLFEEYNIASYFNKDTYIKFEWEGGFIRYQNKGFDFQIPEFIDWEEVGSHNLYIPAERFLLVHSLVH